MQRIDLDESGDGFTRAIDSVDLDREVVIRRPGQRAVVLLPLRDYEGLTKAIHPMSSPANSRRLLGAMERLDRLPDVAEAHVPPSV